MGRTWNHDGGIQARNTGCDRGRRLRIPCSGHGIRLPPTTDIGGGEEPLDLGFL